MATDTIPAQSIFVFVVLGMTGIAILTQFGFVQRLFMACHTSGRQVLATQRVLGVRIMVEQSRFPGLDTVTGFTFLTKMTFVSFAAVIVLAVTAHTGTRRIFVLVAFVTICAFRIHVFAQQLKLGGAVVKTSFFPVVFCMATGAFGSQ